MNARVAPDVRPVRVSHAQYRLEDTDPLVVLPERAVRVNPQGAEILKLCDGEHTAESIAAAVRERHPGAHGIERDVSEFLDGMLRLGVLRAE